MADRQPRLIALPDHAAEVLAGELRALEPGARVPSERMLAAKFGISRGAVREALRILESDGRVVKIPGHGRFTGEGALTESAPVREWLERYGHELQEACEIGAVLQWRAVQRLSEAEARALAVELGYLVRRAEHLLGDGDWLGLAAIDTQFHMMLVSRCRNIALKTLVEELTHAAGEVTGGTYAVPHVAEHSLEQHREIVDALAAGDAAVAGHLVMSHLFSTMRFAQRVASQKP